MRKVLNALLFFIIMVTSVTAGEKHTVAIKSDGTLWSWGRNDNGQLGTGTNEQKFIPTQEIIKATNWSSISAGDTHTIAINSNGLLFSWGDNGYGQLGNGFLENYANPIQETSKSTNWTKVSAGDKHTIAIKNDDSLWGWGYNGQGRLGDGTEASYSNPIKVNEGTDWSKISAGYTHTAAIKGDGTLWLWGYNIEGQLGDGTEEIKLNPTQESSLSTNWLEVDTGFIYSTIAIKDNGTLWGWGDNYHGQIGDGTTENKLSPTQEATLSTDWIKLGAGYNYSVALKTTGTVWGWGENYYGQIGDGTLEDKLIPTQEITSAANWIDICAGSGHTISLKNNKSFN